MNWYVRVLLLVGVIVASTSPSVWAQTPGKLELEAAERTIVSLLGATVFAGDAEIGFVAYVSLDDKGTINAIRVRTGSPLGFGERIVEIPASAFTIFRGTVVLELTS